MEDIGGVIFYIIAAVIGIITTVGKKRRKAKKPSLGSEAIDNEVFDDSFDKVEERQYQTISDLIVDESGLDEEPGVKDETEIISGNEIFALNKEVETKFTEPILERYEKEISPIIDVKMEKEVVIAKDDPIEEDIKGITDIVSEFDLRKAIIYSEIITRKDY